jgi:hypothetical protein
VEELDYGCQNLVTSNVIERQTDVELPF